MSRARDLADAAPLLTGVSAGTISNSKAAIYGAAGEVNATTLQIAGTSITSTPQELNILDGVTADATEINKLDNFSGDVGFRTVLPVGTKTSSYSLVKADVGKYVQVGSGGAVTIPATGNETVTFTVTVAAGKFVIDGVSQDTLTLKEGSTYTFDQADASNANHPLKLSATSDGSHGSGTEYTSGVSYNGVPGQAGSYTRIIVPEDAPGLFYYCANHSGMGGIANTPASTAFAEGDVVSIFNNTSGSITITCSIATCYKAGENTDISSASLDTRGVATVLFISDTIAVITGNLA